MSKDLSELTDLFKRLGANDPAGWASSEINENLPQLAGFLFLRQAWRRIVDEEDTEWIGERARAEDIGANDPFAGIGLALASLLDKGATVEELTDLIRGVQAELLFDICYLLDDPSLEDSDVEDIAWGLFEVDEDGSPLRPIGGLHESVLETDPTGREMRPRHTKV